MTKRRQELEKLDKYYSNIKEADLVEDVKFEIDKNAFKGGKPFKCHGKNTILKDKRISFNNFEFTYQVWHCKACKKDYLDFEQAKKYERFLVMKKLLEDKLVTMERNINYDGKAYFFRFPKE